MANKMNLKNRSKRLSRALGACRHCTPVVALTSTIPDRPDVLRARCPACGRELRLNVAGLGHNRAAVLRRFAQCLSTDEDTCPHSFTITLDGQPHSVDPPCGCGKSRTVLNMSSAVRDAKPDGPREN